MQSYKGVGDKDCKCLVQLIQQSYNIVSMMLFNIQSHNWHEISSMFHCSHNEALQSHIKQPIQLTMNYHQKMQECL